MSKVNDLTPIYSLNHLSICIGVPPEIILQISETAHRLYSPFEVPKDDDSVRKIDNPKLKLKAVQKRILKNLLEPYDLPKQIMGGRKGFGVKDYLTLHTNKPEVVSLDIKSCFPSVSHEQVFKVFREDYGYSKKVASVLTKLTTYRGHLPQGAPSSNMLLNIILTPACKEIVQVCDATNCCVSFWVDDITISGNNPSELIQKVIPIIHKYGFAIRSSKTRIMKQSEHQEVLNHTVNKKIAVTKSKYAEYLKKYFSNIRQDQVLGILNHLEYINPKQARRLGKILILK